jgi:hypothetical protein
MEASINVSPIGDDSPPWRRANPATSKLPADEKIQKAGRGRSPPRRTPKIAVASGRRPRKIMACADVTY